MSFEEDQELLADLASDLLAAKAEIARLHKLVELLRAENQRLAATPATP